MKQKSGGAWKRKLLTLAVASCFSVELAYANPVGPTVTHGKATVATHGNTLTVTNTPGAIINWQSFGVASQEITRFLQQSGASAVLNRVTGATPSAILGQLQSNGRVYLINPNGITIGKNAVIDVAGFVASTHRLSDEDFLKQRHRFQENPGAGTVVNHGEIKAASGGMVYIVGENIENHGVIRTPQGEIVLAAGKSVELVDAGTPEIRVQIQAPDNQVLNLGQLLASGGRIGMYAGLVRHGGTANANTAVVGEDGKIVFKATKDVKLDAGSVTSASGPSAGSIKVEAQTGTAVIAGTVEANATAGRGGNIDITGHHVVTIEPTGRVSATGINGGTVALSSSAGGVQVSGQLDASAIGGRAGNVVITAATQASIAAGAKVNASGPEGGGSVGVSAGEAIKLESGSKLEAAGAVGGAIALASEQGSVEVSGTLDATASAETGGTIKIAARSDITLGDASALDVSGRRGGETWIEAREGTTLASGLIDAYGRKGPGGKVLLLGPRVGLVRNAIVNASGYTGGGVVLIGGDFRGKNPGIQNAERTFVGPDALITADAIRAGDGGKVIIWADGDTRFYGSITAKGGRQGGDGGFVEVSGKQDLAFAGQVGLSALYGKAGSLLLDPGDLYISVGVPLGDPTAVLDAADPFEAVLGATNNYVVKATIEAVDGAVTLLANNNVIFETSLSMTNQGAGETVTVTATSGAVQFNSNSITTGGGDIVLSAGTNVSNIGGLNSGAGNVTVTAGGTITQTGGISANLLTTSSVGGTILNAANTVSSFDATNITSGNIELTNTAAPLTVAGISQAGGGDVIIDNAGAIAVSGALTVPGNLTLTATGSITDGAGATIAVTNNALFSGSSITLGDNGGDTTNFGTLTFTSGGAVSITEDSTTVITGTNTANSLVLVSASSITDAAATSLSVTNNASFSGTSITLGDNGGDTTNLGTLTFNSGGAVSITEDSDIQITGTNTASNLVLTSAAGITDAAATSLAVTGNASLTGTSIVLGDNAGDTTDFGTLTFNSGGAVAITEASATQLTGINTANSLALTSAAGITDAAATSLTVTNNASFTGTSLTLGDSGADTTNLGTLTFNSGGAVSITEDSATVIAGANTANNLVLTSAGSITDAAATSLTVTNNANLNGTSITLGDNGGDTTNFGSLTFNSPGVVTITEDSATVLSGANTASDLTLTSAGDITLADVTVTNAITLSSPGTVTQAPLSAIGASNLALLGTGTYTLNSAGNDVDIIAADGPSGVSYRDSNALTVGTVGGAAGMTVAGDIDLRTGGALVIADAISTSNEGDVRVNNGGLLTVNATITADGQVIQNGNGTTVLNSDIFTEDDLVQFAQNVLLSGNRIIDTSANPGNGLGGTIDFQGNVQGGGNSLTLVTPGTTGDVVISGAASGLSALTISNARDVSLQSVATNGAVDITAQQTATLAGALTAGNGPVILKVNDLDLTGTGSINAGTGAVQIRPSTTTQEIRLGSTGAGGGILHISDPELDRITASGMLTIGGSVVVGGAHQTGTITVTDAISPANATGGFTLLNRTGGIVIGSDVTYNGPGAAGDLFLTANAGNSASGGITDADPGSPFAVRAGNLTMRAATGIGTLGSPMDIVSGTVTATNSQSGGIFLRAPTGALIVETGGLTNAGSDAVSVTTNNGSITVNGTIEGDGAVELTANATGAAPGRIDVNSPIDAGGRVILRAADDITIDAKVSSGQGASDHVYIMAGNASGMSVPGFAPASEPQDMDGGVTITAQVVAGAGDIVINATESVIQAPQPPADQGGGAAGLQNSGDLIVRTYNNTAGAGRIDLRHDTNLTGNSNGPITLETLRENSNGFAASNIDYRSYIGMVISGIGTSADFVAIAATQNIDLDALNIQARNLTLIANAGDVNVLEQIKNSQINNGNAGGSLNLLASGDVNIHNVAGTRGITIGRFKSTGDTTKGFDPDTGLPPPDAIERFDHDLRLVAQNDINIQGSVYVKGDLNLRADASRNEATKVGASPGYGNNQGSVRITVPGSNPVVVSAENIVVGALDSNGDPLPIQHLVLTAGDALPGAGQRRSASASIEAALELDVFLTGNLELTGGNVTASNLPDAKSRVENSAAATIGGNTVNILGVSSKDQPHDRAPDINQSNIVLKGGESTATRTGTNDGAARADASALILSGDTGKINIGGDITIIGGSATAAGSRSTAIAIAGTEIGAQITGTKLLHIVARDMYITGGTRTATDGGVADGFASVASSGAIDIRLTGDEGLTFTGGGGSGLFDALGPALVRVTGGGYPVTLDGKIRELDQVPGNEDGLIVAGAPLVDDSLLAAFLRATEAARQDSLPQDPSLGTGSKGQAGVCK